MQPRHTSVTGRGQSFAELFAADPELCSALDAARRTLSGLAAEYGAGLDQQYSKLTSLGFKTGCDITGAGELAKRLGIDIGPMKFWQVVNALEAEMELRRVAGLHDEAGRLEARRLAKPDPPKGKQSTKDAKERGGKWQDAIVACLIKHHNYPDDLNQTPATVSGIASKLGAPKSSVSNFFRRKFRLRGHEEYVRQCRDLATLRAALLIINNEMTPGMLSGRSSVDHCGRRDDDD